MIYTVSDLHGCYDKYQKLLETLNLGENDTLYVLGEYLMQLLRQKNLKRAQVVEDSGVDKAYVYQIFNGSKNPSRDKLIAITFGMHLNEKETQRVLKLAGHSALYPRVVRDALILFSIQRGKDIWETDDALESNGFQTLLSAE